MSTFDAVSCSLGTGDKVQSTAGATLKGQLAVHLMTNLVADSFLLDSDHSSSETLPMLSVPTISDTRENAVSAEQSINEDIISSKAARIGTLPLPRAAAQTASLNTPHVRKGQGYRRLWQVVSKVQRGQTLDDSNVGKEDVTVGVCKWL